jgi:hypothetical protein
VEELSEDAEGAEVTGLSESFGSSTTSSAFDLPLPLLPAFDAALLEDGPPDLRASELVNLSDILGTAGSVTRTDWDS